jgi:hypothetical protein
MTGIPADTALDVAATLFIDKLTTPDSEDWTILPDGNIVHVTAYREITHDGQRRTMAKSGAAKVSDLKRLVRNLRASHDLGCVSVVLCRDAGDRAHDLLCWLTKMGRKKKFNVVSCLGPATTAKALQARADILAAMEKVAETEQ